jgi:hypothetical protein
MYVVLLLLRYNFLHLFTFQTPILKKIDLNILTIILTIIYII